MLDMQRQIERLNERMDNQGLERGNESDEEGNQGGANQDEENIGEELEEMSYEDILLRDLE